MAGWGEAHKVPPRRRTYAWSSPSPEYVTRDPAGMEVGSPFHSQEGHVTSQTFFYLSSIVNARLELDLIWKGMMSVKHIVRFASRKVESVILYASKWCSSVLIG